MSRQTDNVRLPTLPDIAKDPRCRDFRFESLVYLNPKGPTGTAGGANYAEEPVAAMKKGTGRPRPEITAAPTSRKGELCMTPAGGGGNENAFPRTDIEIPRDNQCPSSKHVAGSKWFIVGTRVRPRSAETSNRKLGSTDGNKFEEDPTREETVGAQRADVPTGLAVADMTTIRGLQTSAEEEVDGTETILIGVTAALVKAHTPQNRAKDQAIQSMHGVEQTGGATGVPPTGAAASTPAGQR